MRVEIYSDVVCPWCYIGDRRFFRALDAFSGSTAVEVVYRPYQLDPGAPDSPRPLIEYLTAKFGARLPGVLQQTRSIAKEEGLDLRFEEATYVNTLSAHRLLQLAGKGAGPEAQHRLAELLFEAHFTRGENVGSPALLADLGEQVGLIREDVQEYLASDRGAADVRAAVDFARRRGILSVPTFVFDEASAVQGAQRTSTFLRVLEEMESSPRRQGEGHVGPSRA